MLPHLAITYPFELDIFQKEAIIHLEQGHSVSCWYLGGGIHSMGRRQAGWLGGALVTAVVTPFELDFLQEASSTDMYLIPCI